MIQAILRWVFYLPIFDNIRQDFLDDNTLILELESCFDKEE